MTKILTIIIVTYNSKDIIDKCLEHINVDEFDIIVVDNGSADGTAEYINENYPEVVVVRSSKNLGYGRGANIGLRIVPSQYAFLINPDLITTASAVHELLDKAKEHKNAAICAPRTRKDKNPRTNDKFEKVDWVVGAAMLFDMELLKKIGLFDENIFLFYEETDLCRRVRKAGMDIIMFNHIFMEHLVGASFKLTDQTLYLKNWHMAWSLFYYNKKHENIGGFLLLAVRNLARYFFKFVVYIITGDKRKKIKYGASLTGACSFLLGKKAFYENGDPRGIKGV